MLLLRTRMIKAAAGRAGPFDSGKNKECAGCVGPSAGPE
jgi:hypothetical protein